MGPWKGLAPGAKLVYGRLVRFNGKDNSCWPAVPTLAAELGLSERMVQKHLNALESQGFIRREKRFRHRAQTSNQFTFLWHRIFDEWQREQKAKEGVNDNSPSPVHRGTPPPVTYSAHKESHIEESQANESHARRKVGVKGDSPKESQRTGERDPVHLGSPKESQGDHAGCVPISGADLAAERKRHLKALRDALNAPSFGDPGFYADQGE